jgi:hypothetical protein
LAYDSDIGENAQMVYSIEGDDSQAFDIITNNGTQEGIITLKKVSILTLSALQRSTKSNDIQVIILCD